MWLAENDFISYQKRTDVPVREVGSAGEQEVIDSVGDMFMLQGEPVAPSKPE